MQRRELGRTGFQVSALALGGHEYLPDGRSRGFNEDMRLAVSPGHIGQGYGGPKRKQVLSAAYDLGINLFDVTIDSEKEALGRNLCEMPPPYEIYVQTRPEGMCYSYDRNNRKLLDYALLRTEVQRALTLLRRETLDLLNVGLLAWSIDSEPEYLATLGHNLGALKQEGLIRLAVADSFSGERLYLAMIKSGAFDAVNLDLNVADTCGLRQVVPAGRAAGLGILAREAFCKGEVFRIGGACGLEDQALLARAAIKWLAQQQPDCVIVGVDSSDQLLANAAAFEQPQLTEDEQIGLERLRAAPGFTAYEKTKTAEFVGVQPS